ncbi:unnamed protein product [Clavelina lepadiformis]|uniref:CUB domain-containing protein n=1 Tax=Clavelina lepadiformis TaxID=159417 RepID=A0ABP0H3H1_CLALP
MMEICFMLIFLLRIQDAIAAATCQGQQGNTIIYPNTVFEYSKHGSNYQKSKKCEWIFEATADDVLLIRIFDLNLHGDKCRNNFTLPDGQTLCSSSENLNAVYCYKSLECQLPENLVDECKSAKIVNDERLPKLIYRSAGGDTQNRIKLNTIVTGGNQDNRGPQGSNNSAAVAGAVVGATAGIVLTILLAWCFIRHKKFKNQPENASHSSKYNNRIGFGNIAYAIADDVIGTEGPTFENFEVSGRNFKAHNAYEMVQPEITYMLQWMTMMDWMRPTLTQRHQKWL